MEHVVDKPKRLLDDTLLIAIMAVLAGCGLIYEYLLSHFAGRVLGALEAAIYTMIGLMIVSMGIGAFAARRIRCAFTGFAWLELAIALLGASAILIISGAIALVQLMPQLLADAFALPPDTLPQGGLIKSLYTLVHYSPYAVGTVLGIMIGMEIPLIARIREQIHQQHLIHNAGTIYGADYIGAGGGAALWVGLMLSLDINIAAALTASANLIAGLIFLGRYHRHIRWWRLLLAGHLATSLLVAAIFSYGSDWSKTLNDLLYLDRVVYQEQTRFQQIVLTERRLRAERPPIYSLYLNGRLQFSASDEHIYHKFLVYPALAASARQDKVLIIGGGDGLALREVLAWQPEAVTLLDLDRELVTLFRDPQTKVNPGIADDLLRLNNHALKDQRLSLIFQDAFNGIDQLRADSRRFDTIIVDLPDPSHPDLNKLYSTDFYYRLKQLLSPDGAMVVQSTSPYHARQAFISIGKTLAAAGFGQVEQYHHNVPSFGEWGWTLAVPTGAPPRQRLRRLGQLAPFEKWLTPGLIQASFEFPADFYQDAADIRVNELGSFTLYHYHKEAWQQQQGLNNPLFQPESR